MPGGLFIYEQDDDVYFIRRNSRVIELSQLFPNESIGYLGSDIAEEAGVPYKKIMEIPSVRFALICREEATWRVDDLRNMSNVRIVTSYMANTARLLDQLGVEAELSRVDGCLEAELRDKRLGFTAAVDLVQTGRSVWDNRLRIAQDYLEPVWLAKIGADNE